MGKILDFSCAMDSTGDMDREAVSKLQLSLLEIHTQAEPMTLAARAWKEYRGAEYCMLPFCHTVEAEAMGGIVSYGNETSGPRGKEYICSAPEELLTLPPIDFETGRIHEVLLACRLLKEQKEHVVLQVSGPLTILNVLIEAGCLFRALRKQPELMKAVMEKLGNEILAFMEIAEAYGADIISYADPVGGVTVLGPKLAEQIVEDFTYGFLKQAERRLGKNVLVHLCPQTVFALLGTGYAQYEEVELPAFVNYGMACIEMIGKIRFAGRTCMKHADSRVESCRFQAVKLCDSLNQ